MNGEKASIDVFFLQPTKNLDYCCWIKLPGREEPKNESDSIDSPGGLNIFDEVNYPLTPCTVPNRIDMECRTPELQLPSVEEFGFFEADYRFGFQLERFEESKDSIEDMNPANDSLVDISIIQLPFFHLTGVHLQAAFARVGWPTLQGTVKVVARSLKGCRMYPCNPEVLATKHVILDHIQMMLVD
ncbi:hypothetical protein CAPTEDRAFT_185631 [Capitella teleta]|uniref:Uncharacterized protein n=1 Tax=Capitella teleta TaxID=283909 RepID=R7UIF6_CAPTE|nr:hypothetical protein CAPTEDRAFT_185631 [Capitella teleta]|eukprot:ELU03568.1 hypothetical protein CAPTEDRAFT_185631 [Capitella teleta]